MKWDYRRLCQFISMGLAVIGLSLQPGITLAEERVVAVEDKDYAPYYVWIDGEPTGPCIDLVTGAFALMGDTVTFKRFPWSRVLRSVQDQKVDAGLCGTRSDERESYSFYPEEPLLIYDATLFVRSESDWQSADPAAMSGLSFAMVKGYSFGGIESDLEAAGMIRVEAANREALWKLLLVGRVDTVLDSVLPMVADTTRMGKRGEIRPVYPSMAETPGYLFFSRAPANEALAREFSEALKAFKKTPEYTRLAEKYGL